MSDRTTSSERPTDSWRWIRHWPRLTGLSRWWIAAAAFIVVAGAMLIAASASSIIDDDFEFGPGKVAPTQSRAVAIAARLIFREVDQNKWSPNDPFFMPAAWLDDMPNFQMGIVDAVGHFVRESAGVSDHGQGADSDLTRAAGLLKYPGTIWKFDPSTSWAPTASSEKMYRNAARNLEGFNARLAAGPGLERRTDTLLVLAASLGHDLAAVSAALDRHLAENHSALFDSGADDLFYRTKGQVYAYGLILREIGWDHAELLSQRDLGGAWRQMVESLRTAAGLNPLVVINGAPDGTFLPSHLTAQGFYLLRARAQLAEIAEQLTQ